MVRIHTVRTRVSERVGVAWASPKGDIVRHVYCTC